MLPSERTLPAPFAPVIASSPLIPAQAGTQVVASSSDASPRIADILAALAPVTDPELDESVVDLGFIARVTVVGDRAEVDFRLPTFWCSANFAWIMAEDMRAALMQLPRLAHADVRLVDHFAAGKVNAGVSAGQSFRAAFGNEAADDLEVIRETFRQKAYLGRTSRLIELLRERGWDDVRILAAKVADLRDLGAGQGDPDVASAAIRFLALRAVYGGPALPADVAFRRLDGSAVTADGLAAWLRDIRMTRRGVEANGEMCRVLLKARIEDPAPGE
jgi:metal-sulfur cluster biosynthetic enzyme